MYQVYNTAGGLEYNGKSLSKAMEYATYHFNQPYIHSSKGKRPVLEHIESEYILGEFGQNYNELERMHTDND